MLKKSNVKHFGNEGVTILSKTKQGWLLLYFFPKVIMQWSNHSIKILPNSVDLLVLTSKF
jgi:hypothetical protein